jgi:hypothetical protein
VNKFKILLNNQNNKQINIPIKMEYDSYGQDDDITVFQEKTEQEIVGKPIDFEIKRFAHSAYTVNLSAVQTTEINYNFYFFDRLTNITTSTIANWKTSYRDTGLFTDRNLYYFEKPFTKSFYKLDLYDSPNDTNQTIYLTLIIPIQQGKKVPITNNTITPYLNTIDLTVPQFTLDCVGNNKESFYIYWINNQRFVNVTNFYMSAKFFNGKTGRFTRMINRSQGSMGSKFTFKPENYFYQKVYLNYTTGLYSIYDSLSNTRIGTPSNPINWYEYVSPE